MRRVMVLALAAMMALPVAAQDTPPEWQATVAAQIAAMQGGDAATALELAGADFRNRYDDANRFLADVTRSGYAPIVAARSFTFGTFKQIDDETAVQVVNITGPDRSLYEAVYQLAKEKDLGWRVEGVVLRKSGAIGV